MEFPHTTLQRLAFSKYLYSLAVAQTKAPGLMATASLLTFHDAVEFFLQVSAEELDVGSKNANFMDYWDLLPKKASFTELPQKESMRRLNKARVALKHHGTLPSQLDIEAFKTACTLFLTETCSKVFGIEYDHISLVEYVDPEAARERLRNAEQLIRESEFDSASVEIAVAYRIMIDDYEDHTHEWNFRSPFEFGGNIDALRSSRLGLNRSELTDVARYVDNVASTLESMQSGLKVLALGLDYRKYSKFIRYLPHVNRMASGDYRTSQYVSESKPKPDKEYLEFCIEFVVESAISLNDFRFSTRS